MSLANRPRFVFGASDWTPSLPARAWNPMDRPLGVTRITATGVPDGELLRRDSLLEMTLRFPETEWPQVEALVRWGLTSALVTVYPDAAEALPAWDLWLESPAPGEDWGPTRSGDYPRVMELTLVWRGPQGVLPWRDYFTVE